MIKKQQDCQTRPSLQDRTLRLLSKATLIPCVMLAVLILSAQTAHAYIDPGTGSMIIQAIAAAVLTAGAIAGVFWRSIKDFFKNLGARGKQGAADTDQPEDSKHTEKKDSGQDDHEG